MLQIKNIKIACEPEMNILCFRYDLKSNNVKENNLINSKLQKYLLAKHKIFLSVVKYKEYKYLRAVLHNPFFNSNHVKKVCFAIKEYFNEKKSLKSVKIND